MSCTTAETDRFIAISLATIRAEQQTNFTLYLRDAPDAPPRLYRDAQYPLGADDLRRLFERGVKFLYVPLGEYERYQKYLRENLPGVLEDETLPVPRRFACLNEVVRDVLAEVFATRNVARTVEATEKLASDTIELICKQDVVAHELLQVLRHDYHTFTHSANVSYYCVLLAKESGITDRDELRQIAAGGLLHDLGKLDIPESILKRPGHLDDEEWEIIKRHPTTGFQLLSQREDLNFGQLMMVYQHHERLDGSGYPVGIARDEIHPWGEICAISDVYEALTSNRPYRPALPQDEVMSIMQRQVGTRFDERLWQCWKTIIEDA